MPAKLENSGVATGLENVSFLFFVVDVVVFIFFYFILFLNFT